MKRNSGRDLIVFDRKVIELDYSPHKAQAEIHNSKARFKILCCGRRFGKTKAAAYEAFFNIFPSGGRRKKPTRGWIVAPTYVLTRELEREFKPLISSLIAREIKSERRYELITGDEIEFRSADSENLVGAGLDWLVIDEAARVSEEVWQECLRPTLTDRLGKAIIISTPRGRNWFWDAYEKGQDDFYPEYESWQFASKVNPYLAAGEIENAGKELPELVFRQEYLAEFLDDATAFFRNIKECVHDEDDFEISVKTDYECPKCGHKFVDSGSKALIKCKMCREEVHRIPVKKPVFYIGVDLAKDIDFTVISVLRYHPEAGCLRLVHLDRFNHISWTLQKERIKKAYDDWGGCIYLDATGLGDPIVEDLQIAGIPAEGIKITNTLKQDMMNRLAILFERGLIKIPDNRILINELRDFEAKQTPGGLMTFSATSGKHDDCVMSLALAAFRTPPIL